MTDPQTDYEVRVHLEVDDWVERVYCEAVEIAEVPGFLVLYEPEPMVPGTHGDFGISGETALAVRLDDVVGVEGDIDVIEPFLRGDPDD